MRKGQFQGMPETKADKLKFIEENFGKVAKKEGDAEHLTVRDGLVVYRTGGITHIGKVSKSKDDDPIFLSEKVLDYASDLQIDEIYNAVASSGKFEPPAFVPDLDEDETEVKNQDNPFLPPLD